MTPLTRLRLLGGLCLVPLLGLGGRLWQVAVLEHEALREQAERRSRRVAVQPARRGRVLDRHGRPLALDLPVDDVTVDLTELDPALELVVPLAAALGLTREEALARLEVARRLAGPGRVAGDAQAEDGADDGADPNERLVLGGAPLERAERARKALRRARALEVAFEPGGLAVTVAPDVLRARDRTLGRLAPLVGRPLPALVAEVDAAVAAIFAQARRDDRLLAWQRPLVVREDAPFDVVARVAEEGWTLPGVAVRRRWRRLLPRGPLAAHLLGTLGAPTGEEAARDLAAGRVLDASRDALGLLLGARRDLPDDARLRDEPYGRTGIEAAYEGRLRGRPGATVLVRDARNRTRATLLDLPARDGEDVTLTLDAELQAAAEAALDQALARHGDPAAGGAAVLVDVRTGDVLALASGPRFDPNTLGRDFPEHAADPRHPLVHRAVQAFTPASTWKILTAFAACDPEVGVPPGWTTECVGILDPRARERRFRCDGVHGRTDLVRAVERSCNVYFFRAADRVGLDRMAEHARALGLGAPVGRGIPGERRGQVPTTATKPARAEAALEALAGWRGRLADALRFPPDPAAVDVAARRLTRATWWAQACLADRQPQPGDARNCFIGQGDVLTTPLQVAHLAALVATGGRTPWLRLDAAQPPEVRRFDLDPAALARVREGMRRVVTHGTASRPELGLRGLDLAGKTGTGERGKGDPYIAWFMGYYPASRPEVALAVVIDRTAGHGGEVCAPVARALVDAYRARRDAAPLDARGGR